MTTVRLPALRFAKGHGTENDFVLVPDLPGELDLSPGEVSALCDRRAGIGGDGLIRVAPVPDGDRESFGPHVRWFMDYRNADGSVAEMCGNGLRVFVAYLEQLGVVRLGDGDVVDVGTRAGTMRVRRVGDFLAADLGGWRVEGGAAALSDGYDVHVGIAGHPVDLPGLSVDVGNPHVVVELPDAASLASADLRTAPRISPSPAKGANVECVVVLPARDGCGHLAMRVYERGVGETRSCGTGAVAAVLAARGRGGPQAPDRWWVDVPGGRLRVTVPAGARLAGRSVELAGPAKIIAEGNINAAPDCIR
jgi:diaminopimelate epimerase